MKGTAAHILTLKACGRMETQLHTFSIFLNLSTRRGEWSSSRSGSLSPNTWPSTSLASWKKVIHLLPLPAIEPRLVSLPVHSSVTLLLLRSTSDTSLASAGNRTKTCQSSSPQFRHLTSAPFNSKMLFIQIFIVTGNCHETPGITSIHQSRVLSGSRWFPGAIWVTVLSVCLVGLCARQHRAAVTSLSVRWSVAICSKLWNLILFKDPVRTAQ